MADRAEIKVVVDTRQARAEVKRTEDTLKRAEARRTQLAERADRVARRVRRGGAAGPGGIRGAGAFAAGVLGGRIGRPRLPTTGPGGLARRAARGVGGLAALTVAVTGAVAEPAQAAIEVLRPVVDRILAETLPKFLPKFFSDVIRQAITEDANAAVDRLRQVARLDTIKARIARRKFLPIAGAFAFSGDAFTADEVSDLSNQFSRASLRQSFLERQESRRSTTGLTKAFIEGVAEALGE